MTILPPEPQHTDPGHWRYLICNPVTGAVLDELPLTTSSLPTVIGDDSVAQFTLPLADPRSGVAAVGVTDPRRVPMLAVLRDGVEAWPGLITTARGAERLSLTAISLEGWFQRRRNTASEYGQVDQLDIARLLIAKAAPLGVGIEVDEQDSGRRRDRTYTADAAEDILAELQELAAVEGGFEWHVGFRYLPEETRVAPFLRFGYPRLGTSSDQPEHRWEIGRGGAGGNLTDVDVAVDCSAGKYATHVVAVGKGQGDVRSVSAPAIASDREAETGIRIELQTSYPEVSIQTTLDAHARADLERVRNGHVVLTATARLDLPPFFGTYRLGDSVRIVIEDTLRFPRPSWGGPGLDVVTRLVGWTLNPENDTINLKLEGGL